MASLVKFFIWEPAIMAMIIINTVSLFVLGFVSGDSEVAFWCFLAEYFCVGFFLIEAVIKISRGGFREYIGSGWNRFDFFIVLLSLPFFFTPFMNLGHVGSISVLRIGRLFRLFRLLHMIPNRSHLFSGIRRAVGASIGVFLALFLVNFTVALCGTFLFRTRAPEFFGNPLISFYTIFKVFTIEGWHEIPDLMIKNLEDPVWAVGIRIFFMAVVLICGILGLSLANAVFVDEMVMDNNRDLELKIDGLSLELTALRQELSQFLDREGRKTPPSGS